MLSFNIVWSVSLGLFQFLLAGAVFKIFLLVFSLLRLFLSAFVCFHRNSFQSFLFCYSLHFRYSLFLFKLSIALSYFFFIVSPSSLLLFSSLACKSKTSFFYSFDLAVFKNGFLQICILLFQFLLFIFYHAVYSSIPCFIFKNNSIVNLEQIVLQFVNSLLHFVNTQIWIFWSCFDHFLIIRNLNFKVQLKGVLLCIRMFYQRLFTIK